MFSDMHFVEEAGDVLGMEVFIVYSTDGLSGRHYALFQIAEGAPSPPVLVPVTVAADRIEFVVPDLLETYGRFRGRVTPQALVGRFEKWDHDVVLPRGGSYWQPLPPGTPLKGTR